MDDITTSHSWLGTFAGRMLQLCPHVSVVSAVQCAVLSIHDAGDIAPARAAEIFVLANAETVGARAARGPATGIASAVSKYRSLLGWRFDRHGASVRSAER